MRSLGRRTVSVLIAIAIVFPPNLPSAVAGMISTTAALEAEKRQVLLTDAETFILQKHVAARLSELGVDQELALARLRTMTDRELSTLAHKMDSMPAGAGAIEIIGIVFLVLLILEIVGVTDIFKKF